MVCVFANTPFIKYLQRQRVKAEYFAIVFGNAKHAFRGLLGGISLYLYTASQPLCMQWFTHSYFVHMSNALSPTFD